MLLDAVPVLILLALAAFILWEGWQRKRIRSNPLDRAAMERGFVPGATAAEQLFFVGAAVLIVLSAMLFSNPPHPPFTGRGAFVSSLVYGALGPLGMSLATAGAAVACLTVGLSIRRRRVRKKRES